MTASDSCNIYVNDMKKQENMHLQRRHKHESINKKDLITKNTVDNDRIQHDSYSIHKKYLAEDTLSHANDALQQRADQSKERLNSDRESSGNRTQAINSRNSGTSIRTGIHFENSYSSESRYRNNKEKDFCDIKTTVYLTRVDRTLAISSSFDLDTPPSENDTVEPRDIILLDSITIDRDNKGLISHEIISNDKSNLASADDVSQKKTPSFVSLGLTHASIEANNWECNLFSVTEPLTTKTILQKEGKLTSFFPIVHQSPVSNLTARIDKAYPNYLVDASTKGIVPSIFNAILAHVEHNIDEESTTKHDPLTTTPRYDQLIFSFLCFVINYLLHHFEINLIHWLFNNFINLFTKYGSTSLVSINFIHADCCTISLRHVSIFLIDVPCLVNVISY